MEDASNPGNLEGAGVSVVTQLILSLGSFEKTTIVNLAKWSSGYSQQGVDLSQPSP